MPLYQKRIVSLSPGLKEEQLPPEENAFARTKNDRLSKSTFLCSNPFKLPARCTMPFTFPPMPSHALYRGWEKSRLDPQTAPRVERLHRDTSGQGFPPV